MPPPPHGEVPAEMQFPGPPMMAPFGYPPHHPMMHPHQMNPNVPTFVPRPKPSPQVAASAPESMATKSTPAASTDERESTQSAPAAKPVSRRLAIIDPTTGEEISIQPVKSAVPPTPPASALVSADLALGQGAPVRPLIPRSSTVTSDLGQTVSEPPVVTASSITPELVPVAQPPSEKLSTTTTRMKLKNAPLPKPAPPVVAPLTPSGEKTLRRIKNVPIARPSVSETPPLPTPTETSKAASSKFKLINKTLSLGSKPSAPIAPSVYPISREVFLRHMSFARPDRNAPSSINVFPSELLGLRTAPHGDPGLSVGRGGRRGGLQKSISGTSANWRSGKLARTLSRQSSRGGRSLVNQVVKPSERGFKIIDQSSLSEKDKLRRQVMSLLNKITLDSFQGITNQISEIEISQPWQMDVVIGLIFDKAVVEHSFSEMYAEMCKKLRTTWPELTGVDQETGQSVPVTFTRAIIEKCEVEFDAMPDTLEPTEADIAKARGDWEDLEMFVQKRKERILGNMKFIAQLFLATILSSRVIRLVVEQLLFRTDEPEEHYIECVGILLHNIGATLMESESGREYVDKFVDRMIDLSSRECYGKRIKFLMRDIVDAARAGWSGKHAGSRLVSSVKTKEEVRKAALDEQKPSQPQRYSSAGGKPVGKSPAPTSTYKPTQVLRRAFPEEVKPKEDSDWSDEESDEASEYESSSESEESHDGFTTVPSR